MSQNSEISKPINSNFGREEEINEALERIAAQEHKIFSYATLAAATDNFADDRMLGKGGYGSVYKGILEDGTMVAVKMLSETSQGTEEFVNEVKLMISLRHRNVVKLLGYGAEIGKHFLVSEFVPNNNLGKLLSDSNSKQQLSWPRRYAIIQAIAYGLLYLHHQHSQRSIVHRDIKPENILIDENWEPKIVDFGLSRILLSNRSNVRTKQMGGTCGYIAPELCFNPNATTKTDVYSFGVMILEIISGQRISKSYSTNGSSLLDEAYDLYSKRLEFMDSTLEASAAIEEVEKCTAIGLLCTQGDPKSRPDMKEVVFMLENQGPVRRKIGRPGLRGYSDSFSGHRVYAPNSKIRKMIWNPINRILGREGHEELKKIDAERPRILGREGHEELKKIDAERPEQFSYMTLRVATRGFHFNSRMLSQENVYKGELKDGREVAVKVLEWGYDVENEAMILSSLQHPNVMKLLGYCADESNRLLVYEYVSNNSLAQLLFDVNQEQRPDWPQRYGIIRGIARGLLCLHQRSHEYLHQDSHESIIHSDIQPDNIVIDEQWKPVITAFCTGDTLRPKSPDVTTPPPWVLDGSVYTAPELFFQTDVTRKSHLFSLGVTILEIIGGKRLKELDSYLRAHRMSKRDRRLKFMDDYTLEASAVAEEVDKCIAIGLLCVQGDPELRPDVKDVVFMLENQGPKERTSGRSGLRGLIRLNPIAPDSPVGAGPIKIYGDGEQKLKCSCR